MVARRQDGASYTQTDATPSDFDEKTPLLHNAQEPFPATQKSKRWLIPQRITDVFVGGVKLLLTPIVVTGHYLVACFHYEDGRFSLIAPVYHLSHPFTRARRKKRIAVTMQGSDSSDTQEKGKRKGRSITATQKVKQPLKRSPSNVSTSTAITSDSEVESERPSSRDGDYDAPSRHTRSKSTTSASEEIAPAKRQIRIKLHNDEALRQRKAAKKASVKGSPTLVSVEAANALKSPASPITSKQLTKFPRAPQPPRPLVPRRQPSYSAATTTSVGPHQKTLILDLDETLIHSMAKGGRYTTGHMVEVKLQQPVGAGGQIIGPQVPILYYVHKRPHCDEFLKKVCKWYNLVIFTASVQEYADPVIDWLETERKYFAGRYYRQHCTFRNGAYIKDLAQVEPDLSRVMIIDNSPMCYVFHEDNAIPIEGWINDPTDHGLLHLIPLLEGLQYVTDVRALLALRLGQPQTA
ncbi:Nuclear envelope morphology protein 1 [Didymosphaeria variabile]|uniref:Nuclear envelope morphology protein 1 n=1 Tax=Didymosphaeria variabile TaxID=1932322 RepID=A0A9W8XUC1_9PLEO|nr:Nuclear envelope morphology protein 1 [Didymosphaeria variabile]KAJ4357855.1 Nuclear envelope morphology protein 1 [Didymosphaeria variabile]